MRNFGLWLALIVAVGSTYEFLALLSPRLPTISRVIQGWRDQGHTVLPLTLFFVISLGVFAQWLWRHLLHERRSSL